MRREEGEEERRRGRRRVLTHKFQNAQEDSSILH